MSPDAWIRHVQRDSWSWLWTSRIQVEVFSLLPRLWDTLNEEQRQVLTGVILGGPPRGRFKEDLDPEDWAELRDRSVWERLARLRRASEPLPEASQVALTEIEKAHPEWELTGSDQEDFPVWSESGTGHESDMTAAEIMELSPHERFEKLSSGGYYRDGRLGVWEGCVMESPMEAFPMIEYMIESQRFDEEILASTFRGLAHVVEPTPAMVERVQAAATNIPQENWGRGIYPFARTAERFITEGWSELGEEVLALWDHSMIPALRIEFSREGPDRLTRAINHPVGDLTEALLAVLRTETKSGNRELPPSIRNRLEQALHPTSEVADNRGAPAAHIIICSRLSWLHWLDAEWAVEHLVPLFDWENPLQAAEAWQGFLWYPQIDPELWTTLRTHFLRAFDHYADIGSRRTKLPELLAQVYVQGYPIDNGQATACLRKVDEAGLNKTAHFLSEMLEGASDKAGRLWVDKVGSFFGQVWPKDSDHTSPRLTTYLATAVLRADKSFPDAVDTVAPLLTNLRDPYRVLRELADSRHPDEHPSATFTLLRSLIADDARLGQTPLVDVIGRIERSEVDLDGTHLERLREAATRG